MKTYSLLLLGVAVALCGCVTEKKLSLAQIRSPERAWINSVIVTAGYFQPHVEEDLLTREKQRFSDMVELSFAPMMADVPKEKRLEWRTAIGEKLGGKWVSVRARIRIGPFGMLGRPTVYLEVETIEEANRVTEVTESGR